MLRVRFSIVLICSLFLFSVSRQANAQMRRWGGNRVAVTGWADDTHFILRTFDSNGNPVIKKVDARTGRSVILPPVQTARELLSESMPKGTSLAYGDVLSPDGKSVIKVKDNDLYYFSLGEKEWFRLTYDSIPEVNPRFSPDGTKLAYTKNKDLYAYDIAGRKEIRLTNDASGKVYNGYASWVYMEEILERSSHYAAFWWSPDSKKIAFLRTDESDVPVFILNRLDEADGIHGKIEATPYPNPGDPNPKVKMGIADIETTKTYWVKTDYNADQYLAWPFWTPDSRQLAVQVLNRDQNDLKILLVDPVADKTRKIYEELRKSWVEIHEDTYVMSNGSGFIVRNDSNGWQNLYYYNWDGKLVSQLTDLGYRVTGIERVDEDRKLVYFTATGAESTDSHLFRVGLDGKNLVQMTGGHGLHSVNISPDGSYYTDTWNSIDSAGSIDVYNRKAVKLRSVFTYKQPPFDQAKDSRSEMVRIKTSDGLFNMPAIITYPVNFDPSKKYPVVFTIYGGPDSKNVYNRWQGSDPSWYAQNGIITFTVDHRGSGQFGRKGLDYLYRNLGKWEILDYEDAVKWLRTKPYVDPGRIGITGSSYGGYMTCMALTRGAGYWTHGFAGSSVTDWRLYDDVYTERYMDTPKDNPDGYRESSTLQYVKDYTGKLFMTHGDMDDNVHFQNAIYLISRLEDNNKVFGFMLYPGGRHGWGGEKAVHSRNEAHRFWLRNFFGKE